MKKVTTDSKQFGILRMLDDFARMQGLPLSDQVGHEQFVKRLSDALKQHQANPVLVHGFRVQTMFAYLAASLGACRMITEEDAGEFYTDTPHLKRPDFRILTCDGAECFVEVKNFNQSDPVAPYLLKRDYVDSLRSYADAFKKPLLIAIYWARWKLWTLNPLTSFSQTENGYSISLVDTGKTDQKSLLGDCMIGIPKPLALRFYTDPEKPRKMDQDGQVQFTIQRTAFVAAEQEIVDPFEKKLAWFFLRYGRWEDFAHPAQIVDGELLHFDTQGEREDPNPDQAFLIVGQLSEMITRQFDEKTTEGGQVVRLSPEVGPEQLGVVIPNGFRGDVLRIWRFTLRPDIDPFDRETTDSQ